MISRGNFVFVGALWVQGTILPAFFVEESYTVQSGYTLPISVWKAPDLQGPSVLVCPTGRVHFRRLGGSMRVARASLNSSKSLRNVSASIFPVRS